MTGPQFTPLQALVAQHYADGEFAHITSVAESEYCGDTLFAFCLREAGDAADAIGLATMLDRAADELHSLATEIVP